MASDTIKLLHGRESQDSVRAVTSGIQVTVFAYWSYFQCVCLRVRVSLRQSLVQAFITSVEMCVSVGHRVYHPP